MRPHLSLDVRDVSRSVAFYEKVFGVRPKKQTADYAKFDLQEPALNFSLLSSTGRVSEVNHLGIEVADGAAVTVWEHRLREHGLVDRVQENVTCCFARQDKVWFTDPDGNTWEVFTVREQLPVEGSLAATGCCVPKSAEEATASPAACGCR
jgi:catechol 2,3-dioxygenase-like lactoylglutathione lyase family enzyme